MGFDYTLNPVDKTARIVTSQSGCTDSVTIGINGMRSIIHKLQKRQQELKLALGITNKKQLKNRKYYRNHKYRPRSNYNTEDPHLFRELLENGLRMKEIGCILAEMKGRIK